MISGDKIIKVSPDIVEMTGGERIIYFYLNGCKCSAKVPLDYNIEGTIELRMSEKDMYFFDSSGGDLV